MEKNTNGGGYFMISMCCGCSNRMINKAKISSWMGMIGESVIACISCEWIASNGTTRKWGQQKSIASGWLDE